MKKAVLMSIFFLTFFRSTLFAEGVSGSMELNYSAGDSVSNTAQGASVKSNSDFFQQRYRIFFSKNLYPHLRWNAGGTFEKSVSSARSEGANSESTVERFAPLTSLQLSTPFINAGAGFSRIEEKQSSMGTSATAVRDAYFANLGLRPLGLPRLDVSFQKANTYDKSGLDFNRTNETLSISSAYSPWKGLDLRYQASYLSASDLMTNSRVDTATQTGRATYAGQLLKGRVSIGAGYNVSESETEVIRVGGGETEFQEFPIAGLAGIDIPPATATDDALTVKPELINNVTQTGTQDINLNIGFMGGMDIRPRNMGLDFGVGSLKEINTLYVYVSDAVDISHIADYYNWEVYVSSETTEADAVLHWTLHPITSSNYNPLDRRFEIRFPDVKTRLVKTTTRFPTNAPAAGTVAYENIYVTELQAFNRKSLNDLPEKSRQGSTTYDLSIRTRLLNYPMILHDFYYWLAERDPGEASRRVMINGLSLTHTFNRIFSGGARVSREDSSGGEDHKIAYVYSASLKAVPLKTLSHNLVLSSRAEETTKEKHSGNLSIFLNNLIELYEGVNLVLSEGVSYSTSESGQKTDSIVLKYGANIVPHKTLSMSFFISDSRTKQSGGGYEPRESSTERSDLTLAYRPFETLYLFYSYGLLRASGREPSTLQGYGVTFSPFPDGALQFNVAYTENLLSDNVSRSSTLSPSIRWNVNRTTSLNVNYQLSKSESEAQNSETKSFSLSFTITF